MAPQALTLLWIADSSLSSTSAQIQSAETPAEIVAISGGRRWLRCWMTCNARNLAQDLYSRGSIVIGLTCIGDTGTLSSFARRMTLAMLSDLGHSALPLSIKSKIWKSQLSRMVGRRSNSRELKAQAPLALFLPNFTLAFHAAVSKGWKSHEGQSCNAVILAKASCQSSFRSLGPSLCQSSDQLCLVLSWTWSGSERICVWRRKRSWLSRLMILRSSCTKLPWILVTKACWPWKVTGKFKSIRSEPSFTIKMSLPSFFHLMGETETWIPSWIHEKGGTCGSRVLAKANLPPLEKSLATARSREWDICFWKSAISSWSLALQIFKRYETYGSPGQSKGTNTPHSSRTHCLKPQW